MALYRKYRAKKFSELVGQEHVTKTLLQAVKSGQLVHAYLLTGPRGIGKTSTARLLAKAINCEELNVKIGKNEVNDGEPCNKCGSCLEIAEGRSLDVIEIDAASHTGVDDVRDLIEKSRLAPAKSAKKVYIIDEVHMLSKSAFNALLKTLEEPPAHVVFIMATTESHKIPATILSRAQRFDFRRASKEEIVENLKQIAKSEKIEIDDEALELIAISAEGGHRDAIGLLEQVATGGEKITAETAKAILGIADAQIIFEFIGAIFNTDPEEGLKIAHKLYSDGYDMQEFNRSVIEALRKILLFVVTKSELFADTKENISKIKSISEGVSKERVSGVINNFVAAGALLKDVAYPVLPIEMAVIKSAGLEVESRKSKVESVVAGKPSIRVAEQPKKTEPSEPLHPPASPPLNPSTSPSLQPSTPPPLTPSTIDTVSIPVLDMTRDIWDQVIENTKKQNSTLAALLRDAKPEGMTDDTLIVGVKFKFHKERISEAKNREALELVVRETLGKSYKIECKLIESKPVVKAEPKSGEDLEKVVGEVFEI